MQSHFQLLCPFFVPVDLCVGGSTVSLPSLCVSRDLCSLYRQDQEICAAVLLGLLPSIRSLGTTRHTPEEMRHVQGSLLQVVSGFWSVVC